MFSSSLRTALVSFILTSAAVSAAPGLSLKLSGPASVDGVHNLKVLATITNSGDETLKVLEDPRGALSDAPTHTFHFDHAGHRKPEFVGILAKYNHEYAIKHGVYQTLAPGQSVTVEHDLSKAYNFTASGPGAYTIEAQKVFYIVDGNNKPVPLNAQCNPFKTHISGKLAVARSPVKAKRENFRGCSADEEKIISEAVPAAENYVTNAISYLKSHESGTERFTTWFGSYGPDAHTTVTGHYEAIHQSHLENFTYDCGTCTRRGVFAYVYPQDLGTIYLCDAFWNAGVTGTDSRAGTIVHEASHFDALGGTRDYAYGQPSCKYLAQTFQDEAIMNADSHEYFAENTPALG